MEQNVSSLGGAINSSTNSDAAALVTIRENITFKKKSVFFMYSNTRRLGLNINRWIKEQGLDFDQVAKKVICSIVSLNVLLSR